MAVRVAPRMRSATRNITIRRKLGAREASRERLRCLAMAPLRHFFFGAAGAAGGLRTTGVAAGGAMTAAVALGITTAGRAAAVMAGGGATGAVTVVFFFGGGPNFGTELGAVVASPGRQNFSPGLSEIDIQIFMPGTAQSAGVLQSAEQIPG
jgi:hypothetical protein